MPKTIIKIKTWVCPLCDYHQDFDANDIDLMALHFRGLPLGYCPSCRKEAELVSEVNPDKKATHTIMGEEDIELEITEERTKGFDISTEAKKNAYRGKRRKDIQDAIARARDLEDI